MNEMGTEEVHRARASSAIFQRKQREYTPMRM